jgi:hypothetical protein
MQIERAKSQKDPIRCWFCRGASAEFSACGSANLANTFARDALRIGSTARVIALGQDGAGNVTNQFYDYNPVTLDYDIPKGGTVPHGTGSNWQTFQGGL